jgi:DNA-binding XRE family transcriptional regulator
MMVVTMLDAKKIGVRLKEARKSCGITQQVAADAIGVTRTAITQMENGHRQVSTLELSKLSELYGWSVSDFFRDSPSPKKKLTESDLPKEDILNLLIEAYTLENVSRGYLLDASKKLEVSGRRLLEIAENVKFLVDQGTGKTRHVVTATEMDISIYVQHPPPIESGFMDVKLEYSGTGKPSVEEERYES